MAGDSVSGSRPTVWTRIAQAQERRQRSTVEALKTRRGSRQEEKIDTERESSDTKAQHDADTPAATEAAAADPALPREKGPEATYMLVVGSKGAGKTTAVAQLIGTSKGDEKPKPTVALEYTYGRRTNAAGDRKDLCQIWELGGGTKLINLIPVVLVPSREKLATVVIAVDLSKPAKAFADALSWIQIIRKTSRKSPIIIFGTKYDVFQNQDGLKRKALCQAMRYLVHEHKTALVFISKKDKSAISYARAIVNHHIFRTEKKRSLYVDPNKPLIVTQGRDKLDNIGMPPGVTAESPAKTILEAWQGLLDQYFGDQSDENADTEEKRTGGTEEDEEDTLVDTQILLSPEPVVDARRREKAIELDQYRAQVSRKQRLKADA